MESFFLFFAPLFILGGIWSFMFVGFLFVVLLALTENEHDFWAVFVLILFGWGVVNFNQDMTFPSIGEMLTYVAYYFVAGASWSVGKWYFFVKEKAVAFGELKVQFFKRLNEIFDANDSGDEHVVVSPTTKIPEKFQDSFKQHVDQNGSRGFNHITKYHFENDFKGYLNQFIPSAISNKSKLVRWIMWWPLSATWTIINDPIRKLANYIFGRLQGVYTRISNAAFAGMIE